MFKWLGKIFSSGGDAKTETDAQPKRARVKGRYKAEGWDTAFGFAGASPNMIREWIEGTNDLLNDRTEEGLKKISYNFPALSLLGLDDDLRALGVKERFRY